MIRNEKNCSFKKSFFRTYITTFQDGTGLFQNHSLPKDKPPPYQQKLSHEEPTYVNCQAPPLPIKTKPFNRSQRLPIPKRIETSADVGRDPDQASTGFRRPRGSSHCRGRHSQEREPSLEPALAEYKSRTDRNKSKMPTSDVARTKSVASATAFRKKCERPVMTRSRSANCRGESFDKSDGNSVFVSWYWLTWVLLNVSFDFRVRRTLQRNARMKEN